MTDTSYEHIYLSDNGIAFIENTNSKVIEIVIEHIAYGWSPEEIQFQHNYLTLGQIYSALAYYWDHFKEMNNELKDMGQKISVYKKNYASTLLQNKLKAKKTG